MNPQWASVDMSWFTDRVKEAAVRASDALVQAVGIIAPPVFNSRLEEFEHRWDIIARFLLEVVNGCYDEHEQRRLLLHYSIQEELQKLVMLLHAEEAVCEKIELKQQGQEHHVRECLEFLLEEKILPMLCDAGKRDHPKDIMPLILQFAGCLFSRISYPILPAREVHLSIVNLLHAATHKEVEDPIVRKHLVHLLNVLWKKLQSDPAQTEFFFRHGETLVQPAVSPRSNSDGEIPELVLFTALLPHMYALGSIGEKCREALAIAASIQEPSLCRFILQLTPFCHYVLDGIISTFETLPPSLFSSSIPPSVAPRMESRTIAHDMQVVAVRLRFCCTLCMVARYQLTLEDEEGGGMSIAEELLVQFQDRFLWPVVAPILLHSNDELNTTAMMYADRMLEELSSCSTSTSSNPLLCIYLQFLLHEDANREKTLPMTLCRRITSENTMQSIAAMDLYTHLLELNDPKVDALLLGSKTTETHSFSSTDASISHKNHAMWFASRFPNSSIASNAHLWKLRGFDQDMEDVEIPVAQDGEQQVMSLLSYIADAEYAACRSLPQDSEVTYENSWEDWYLDDDKDEYDAFSTSSREKLMMNKKDEEMMQIIMSPTNRSLPSKTLKDLNLSMGIPSFSPAIINNGDFLSTTEDEGYSKVFLELVFHRLADFLSNTVEENIALSGLVASLASREECGDLVFDIYEEKEEGQSVRSILEEVYAVAWEQMQMLEGWEERLIRVRSQLLVDEQVEEDEEEVALFSAFVVLEEMLKELCSMLFAKAESRILPVEPEGYYLAPRSSHTSWNEEVAKVSHTSTSSQEDTRGASDIEHEFEQLLKEATSSMQDILASSREIDRKCDET